VRVCVHCGQENPEVARFCHSSGAALIAEESPASRKIVTVLFCDLVGSTSLGDRADPEVLRELMRSYHSEVRTVLERHGGTVESSDREVGFCEVPKLGCVLLALISPLRLRKGSRRGPVIEPETTRTISVARERKHAVRWPDRFIAAGHGMCPRNLAKVGVAGSNPVVRSREAAGQGRCEPALSCYSGRQKVPGVPSRSVPVSLVRTISIA
jgi:hypothetical protein